MIGKGMMKNAYLPKVSILLRFGVEILALLYPDDSIQILLILPQFQTYVHMKKSHNFINSNVCDVTLQDSIRIYLSKLVSYSPLR